MRILAVGDIIGESGVRRLKGDGFFTVVHNVVDQLSNECGVIHRIRKNFSFETMYSSGHFTSLLHKDSDFTLQ